MAKAQTTRCAIYTRVSTDLQAEKDFSSCESQEQKIRSFIESQNDWQIFKVYSDLGFTGANINRPALQELVEDVKQGKIDIILSYKIDRLTRSPKDFYQLVEVFNKYRTDFISITERFDTSTPAGRLLRNIMLTFAQFERELTSERTKDKALERAKKGMCGGGLPPFGYKKENKKLVVNKKEAEIIRLVFETYIKTGSIGKVYDLLKEKNVKNGYDNPFRKSAIVYILRNVVYAGKIEHNKQIYQGIHQPVISEELFELAQKTHKKRIRKFRNYKNFLFGGLVNCKNCACKMTPCFSNKWSKGRLKRYYYYRCTSTHHKDWKSCPVKQISSDRLEKYILENLERISLDKNYIENLVFKLNSSWVSSNTEAKKIGPSPGYGFELTKVCSKLEPEIIFSSLKFFLNKLSKSKGVERNILTKRFIEKIIYDKEDIEISLFYGLNSQIPEIENETALREQGDANFSDGKVANWLLPQKNGFANEDFGCRKRIRTITNLLLNNYINVLKQVLKY
ncbi:MAG: recombinase family protein [Actinobacteria bacterium]|nr:recombinase family protein [Actinomycetota bacterium]